MGIDYGFKVGIGIGLDEEVAKKIINKFGLEIEEDIVRCVNEEFWYKSAIEDNLLVTFSSGNFYLDDGINYWLGVDIEDFNLNQLEEILQQKDKIIKWFSEFGLDIKWEDLKFINELKIY